MHPAPRLLTPVLALTVALAAGTACTKQAEPRPSAAGGATSVEPERAASTTQPPATVRTATTVATGGTAPNATLVDGGACDYLTADKVGTALQMPISKTSRSDSDGFGRHECKYFGAGGSVDIEWTEDPMASHFQTELDVINRSSPTPVGGLGDNALYVPPGDGQPEKVFVLTPKGRLFVALSGTAGASDTRSALIDLTRQAAKQVAF